MEADDFLMGKREMEADDFLIAGGERGGKCDAVDDYYK